MNLLETRALAIGYHGQCIGEDLDLTVVAGEVLCLLGPNGGGKTTLFRTLLGILPPLAGQVRVAGRPLGEWRRTELARQLGYVPQAHAGIFAFTVMEVVLMGRAARVGRFAMPSALDREVAEAALEDLGILALRDRAYTEISGGERQLVLLARALAQEAKVLILDEPTASLDFGNQLRTLDRIDGLRRRGIAVLMSTHQPEHALRVADRIALLREGRLQAIGAPAQVATAAALSSLYGVEESAVVRCLGAHPGSRPVRRAVVCPR